MAPPMLHWVYRVDVVYCLAPVPLPPLHSRNRKRPAPTPPVVERNAKQFFESINPKGDFEEGDEALEQYLYEKSLKIQPKEADRPPNPDVKPKHSSATLRSPGIKPPRTNAKESGNLESKVTSFAASFGHLGSSKSNTYTSRHTSHESQPKTAPPTPGYDTGDNRSPGDHSHAAGSSNAATLPPPHGRSPHPSRPNAPPEDSVPAHFVLADVESRTRGRASTLKTATLPRSGPPPSLNAPATSALVPPPPILPRRATTKPPSSAPSGAAAAAAPAASAPAPPPLHPRRAGGAGGLPASGSSPGGGGSSPSSSSTTTTSARATPTVDRPAAFVFPSPQTTSATGGSPPALPPRGARVAAASISEASSPNSLRVTLDSRLTLSPTSGDETSVSPTVSLSMPVPPALPPRRKQGDVPPPLPPKMNQSPPNLQAPPLPPKTYKRRMHSASPTNME